MNDASSILGEDLLLPEGATHVVSTSFTKFEHVTVGILYLLFCVMGMSTNLLTALTFYKDSGLLQHSKPWLHICLALTNVAVVAPAVFPASSSFSGRWLYGETMCQAYAFEGMLAGITAIGTVIALCMERYTIGANTESQSSSFYTWSILALTGNGLFWAVMPLLGWSKYTVELAGTSCAIDWVHPDHSYISYILNLEIFSFTIPMILAGLCLYWAQGRGQTGGEGRSATATGTSGQGQSSSAGDGFSEDQLKSLCYIFILFVMIGWGPFAFLCTSTMITGGKGLSMLAGVIPPLACKLMVTAYPLAYAITSQRFRRGFLAMLGGSQEKID